MDVRQLGYVIAVADELNFTRAAVRCHIAQSGLSHQVAALEREVGAVLFERSSRSVRLTPAGHVFLAHARRILRDVETAVAEVTAVRGEVQGRLRLGSIPVSYGDIDVLGLLREYCKAYPAIDVSLSDAGSLSTVSSVLDGDLDAAFVGLFDHQVPPGIVHRLIKVEPLVAVVPRHHPLRGAPAVSLTMLADGSKFLESHVDSGLRAQVDEACARSKARRQVVCELRNPADLASLALQGLGVAVVPLAVAQSVVTDLDRDCIVRLADLRAVQPVAFIHRDPEPTVAPAQALFRLVAARWPIATTTE